MSISTEAFTKTSFEALTTPEAPRAKRQLFIAVGVLGVGWILALILALRSDGDYMDDELLHFLVARAGAHSMSYLLDPWGRPGFTALFAPVSAIGNLAAGFMADRLLTSLVMLLAGWLTYRTAHRMRAPMPWLAPVVLLAMPLWLGLSFTPTTEACAALYTIAGTWCLSRGNRWLGAILFGLLPITRHEMIALLPPIMLYFLFRRDILAVILLSWGEVTWNLLAAVFRRETSLPFHRYFSHIEAGNLGTGNIVHYVNRWMELCGTGGAGLAMAGIIVIAVLEFPRCRKWLGRGARGRRSRMRLLVAGGPLALVGLHTLLYHFNQFASGGYARFLLPGAPWMAIASLFAINAAVSSPRVLARLVFIVVAAFVVGSFWSGIWLDINRPIRVLASITICVAGLVQHRWLPRLALFSMAVLALHHLRQAAHPYRLTDEQRVLQTAINTMHERYPDSPIVGESPWVVYFQNEPLEVIEFRSRTRWQQCSPPGLIYIYDQSHCTEFPMEWFTKYPSELVYSGGKTPDPAIPFVRAIKRLPG